MMSESLTPIMENARWHLDALSRGEDGYENGAIEGLMSVAYQLGKVVSASPELLSERAVQRFLGETAAVINEQNVDLSFYQLPVLHRFEGIWESNEWEQLCVTRSGIQFFVDLFRETALADDVAAINASDIDELIRKRGNDEGYLPDEKIPPEIPLSHWWWWYPKPPRRRQDSQAQR